MQQRTKERQTNDSYDVRVYVRILRKNNNNHGKKICAVKNFLIKEHKDLATFGYFLSNFLARLVNALIQYSNSYSIPFKHIVLKGQKRITSNQFYFAFPLSAIISFFSSVHFVFPFSP